VDSSHGVNASLAAFIEAMSSMSRDDFAPNAVGDIAKLENSGIGVSKETLPSSPHQRKRRPPRFPGFVCPTDVSYCQDKVAVDWASFVAFAQRKSNVFVRSRMTQMIGITVPGELDGIKQPLADGAKVNLVDKTVRFRYESDRRWLEPEYNVAGDPAMEVRVLMPILNKAEKALEEVIDAIIVTDDAGTYGVSLAVVAKRFSVPPPRAYDLIYEVPKNLYYEFNIYY